MQHNFVQQKSSNWVIYREKNFAIKRGGGGLAKNLYRKLNTYAKDLNFSRLEDVQNDMNPYC